MTEGNKSKIINGRHSLLARYLTPLLVGFLFWSMGGVAGWRVMQAGLAPYPGFKAFTITKEPAVYKSAPTSKQKLELSRRLSDAVKQPGAITASDIAAVDDAWGKDAAKMLKILKDSSR